MGVAAEDNVNKTKTQKVCFQIARCAAKESAPSLWLMSLFLTFFLIEKKCRGEHWYSVWDQFLFFLRITSGALGVMGAGLPNGQEEREGGSDNLSPQSHRDRDHGWRPGVCPHWPLPCSVSVQLCVCTHRHCLHVCRDNYLLKLNLRSSFFAKLYLMNAKMWDFLVWKQLP